MTPEVHAALKELSRREGVTMFMTLLAVFQILLYRYSGQKEIVVGSPVAGRNYAETESLIGFFVNTLVLRTDLEGEPGFAELLQRVKEVCLGAYAHQDVPFEKVVEELQPERDPSRSPLFQTMFVLQNAPREQLRLSGLQLSPTEGEHATAKFDLTLVLTEREEELHGSLEYKTDLFERARMERMVRHFEVLLQGVVKNPEQRLWELPLLREEEERQAVVAWNDTESDFPRAASVSELFERQVELRPDDVAVVCGTAELTYGELNARANQLAHYLRRQRVGPEVVVGVCLERSLEMVVGLLGILKAGGTYLPLDPDYPQQRLEYMLADAQVELTLSERHLLGRLPVNSGRIIAVDEDGSAIAKESAENLINESEATNLAYVNYTSGSTGWPKGVGIPQRAISRLVLGTNFVQITPIDRVAQASTVSFDAATFEVWGALLNGARLVIVDKDVVLSPQVFAQVLREQEISTLFLTPVLFNRLVQENVKALVPLKHVVLGGEALDPRWVRAVLEEGAPQRLLNGYGPTESTTFATWELIENVDKDAATVPIGKALANTAVFVMDQWLRPVPVGINGEICIAGDGLARGYLNDAMMTAERFVPHPYSVSGGERLYRTGDEGRYLEDGRIECLGRRDHQVKLHGHRIELGEIETMLESHASVHQAVVMVREESKGDRRLVGYVVGHKNLGSEREAVTELRGYLRERLPDYMVPQQWVVLEQMPVTANGKVDRQSLPAPGRQDTGQASAEPLTPIEKTLADIWSSILQVDHIGRHDNFFELGGDSILSIRIISKAHELGLQLTPRDIFRHQTIAELAAVTGSMDSVIAEQETIEGSVPLTPIQQWFFERELSNFQHFNQSVLLEVPPSFSLTALKHSIEKLLDHHDALRMRFPDAQPRINSHIVAEETNQVLQKIDLSNSDEQLRTKELATIAGEVHTSLNISDGPLVRFVFFNFGPHESGRLLIVIHHLVVDGVSWRILVDDLRKTYEQAIAGELLNLPSKTTSVKRWAESLQQYAHSEGVGD